MPAPPPADLIARLREHARDMGDSEVARKFIEQWGAR